MRSARGIAVVQSNVKSSWNKNKSAAQPGFTDQVWCWFGNLGALLLFAV